MTTLEFNHQVVLNYESLKLFTRKFTSNEQDSDDLIQETITKALSNKNKFSSSTNLKAWLYTIMRNTFINEYRKKKNRRTYLDTSDNSFYLNVNDAHTFNNPTKSTEYYELLGHIDTLPLKLQTPFKQYFEGFKYDEIAEKNNIPVGTVKNRIFQARKMIQEKVAA